MMVTLTQGRTRRHGVTFAHVVVENESAERKRVRLQVEVDGAIWPPRRRGVPDVGWDADGVTVTVAGGGCRGIGFATPEPVDGEFAAVESIAGRGSLDESRTRPDRWRDETTTANASERPTANAPATATAVVQSLGAFSPPLAATPRDSPNSSHGTADSDVDEQ